MNEITALFKLARANGLIDSIADPIAPLEQANFEALQKVAQEISVLISEVSGYLFQKATYG